MLNEINMKNSIALVLLITGFSFFANAQTQGEKLFKSTCVACHTVGKGKLVGPDLKGVNKKYDEKWLISFIRSSQALVKKGDARAVKTFNENNKIPMPDNNLSDADIKSVLAYINLAGGGTAPAKAKATVSVTPAATQPKTANKVVNTWIPSDIKIKSIKVDGIINPKDLNAEYWNKTSSTIIAMLPQRIVYPNLQEETIKEVKVKSVYSEKQFAFLLEWEDKTKDEFVDVDQFCDQIAVQLPVDVNNIPSFMMGNEGGKVHIVHWKAIWQRDCEKGFRDVQDAYPNMWVDIYPGQEGELDRSKRVYAKDITAEQIVENRGTFNMPGTASNNPMSSIKRKVPVEEASAIGFGTLSTQETQSATGWADWKDGKWTVCIVVPVNTGNIFKANFKDKTKLSLAVWNGDKQNVGGRKHYSPWSDVILEKL